MAGHNGSHRSGKFSKARKVSTAEKNWHRTKNWGG